MASTLKPFGPVTAILLAGLAAGCASTTIRPGLWQLRIDLERIENGKKFDTIEKKVNVHVWPVPDQRKKDEWHVEEAEIGPLPTDSSVQTVSKDPTRIGRKPIYADIYHREEKPATIEINTMRDESWTFHMLGTIKDDRTIVGNLITGRPRFAIEAPANFQGKWSMTWLADIP